MSRLESAVIRVALVTLISVTVFYTFWISGFLLFSSAGEGYIKWTALIGLALGLVAGLLLQARLAPGFYLLPVWLLVVGYLVLLIGAVGLGMGVPVGTPMLGVLVGFYAARRAILLGSSGSTFLLRLRRTMVWTVGACLAILAPLWSVTAVNAAMGLETGVPDFMGNRALSHVVFLIAVVLLAPGLQGLLTEVAGRFIFARSRLGQRQHTSAIGP